VERRRRAHHWISPPRGHRAPLRRHVPRAHRCGKQSFSARRVTSYRHPSLLAGELGKLPNHMAMEGHTDAKPYPPTATSGNWELSADRANAARRFMQLNGLGPDQVSQLHGFASQRLRKPNALDPSNRRLSLIVQYLKKSSQDDKSIPPRPASGKTGAKPQ